MNLTRRFPLLNGWSDRVRKRFCRPSQNLCLVAVSTTKWFWTRLFISRLFLFPIWKHQEVQRSVGNTWVFPLPASEPKPRSIKLASIPVVWKEYLKNLGESKATHVINIEREIHKCFSQFLHLHDGIMFNWGIIN